MTKIRRGAAHCRTIHCSEREKLVPLVPFAVHYTCPRCQEPASIDAEFGAGLGSSRVYNEVRVYFGFDAGTRTYSEVASAEDHTLVGQHAAYAFFSPLIRDRREADRVAATLLAKLNGERGDVRPLRTRQTRSELVAQGWRVVG